MKVIYPSLLDPSQTIEVWYCDEPCCGGKGLHRDDGPAVIYPDGTKEWWRHGRRLGDDEVAALRDALIAKPLAEGLGKPVVAPEKATFPKAEGRKDPK